MDHILASCLGTCIAAAASITIAIICAMALWPRSAKQNPPGPPQYPVIGNYLHIPVAWTGKHYAELARVYGPMIYFVVPGRRFVVLHDLEDALNLLEKRGNIYSDRPYTPMCDELVNRKDTVAFIQYGERWKQYRRLIATVTSPRAVTGYAASHAAETRRLLARLLEDPDDFVNHLYRHIVTIMVKLVYGHTVEGKNDPYPQWSRKMAYLTDMSSHPGRWLVDSFPWMRYIPDWFPLAEFKRLAKQWRAELEEFTAEPLRRAKERITAGTAEHCFVVDQLEDAGEKLSPQREEYLKYAAAGMYSGGVDSPASYLTNVFLYMVIYPEAQRKAQAELDRVVGRDRLPNMDDAPYLPYVNALIQEMHRIHPVLTMVPHATNVGDVYKGYTIPPKTTVIANVWAFSRDETMYPEPERFDPDRFLDDRAKNAVDPRQYAFGLGRRRCPGIAITDSVTFLAVASILSVFNIERALDEQGNEIIPELKFNNSLITRALPFKCRIVPRSPAAAALVQKDQMY